jgi:hypothetical protein
VLAMVFLSTAGRNGKVAMKALAHAFEQLRGGLQVNLGPDHGAVAKVSGEQRQLSQKVRALARPRQQPVDGKGTAQIMDVRASRRFLIAQPELADNGKGLCGMRVLPYATPVGPTKTSAWGSVEKAARRRLSKYAARPAAVDAKNAWG